MKAIFIAFSVLFMPILVRAQQSIAPSVNNLAGIDGKLSNTFITTSIGEPAIITIGNKEGFITQGFLQPEILPCVDLEFKYYPNPATDIIHLEALGCEIGILSMEVLDMWGRTLLTVAASKNNEVNLVGLAQGVYLIKVTLTNDEVHTVPIVKSSN
jgi:hypothetical protein